MTVFRKFWRRKPAPPRHHPLPGWPAAAHYRDNLAGDLLAHLYEAMYAVLPRDRQDAHWVMTAEWFGECRKLRYPPGRSFLVMPSLPDGTEWLFGLPVEVREGSGPPHLEPRKPGGAP